MKQYISKISSLLIIVLLMASCHKDLETVYDNKPDRDQALSNPGDVYALSQNTFYNWYMAVTSSLSPRMAMWVMADQGTCSWANSGMYHLSSEPRTGFDNTTSYTYADIFARYYADLYGTLFIANNTLLAIENNGMEIIDPIEGRDNTQKVRAMGYFIQGLTLGYIGLVYDKAFIMTQNSDYEADTPVSSYKEILEQAKISLDSCILISENNNFRIESTWINGTQYRSSELAELARSFIVRFLVYGSRNAQENSQISWDQVLEYAEDGIDFDLAPYMDNDKWVCYYRKYTVRPGWARIDSRIIHMMDENYPWRFPDDGVPPAPASSNDARLESDFTYNPTNNMKPERGYYHFSNYEYTRNPYQITVYTGKVIDFPVSENDLFRAEAYAELGDLSQAIEIINNGTRVSRGHLDPLPNDADKETVMNAIYYERDIELIQTGFGNNFFDMRRRDMLQKGTMLHFPIPAKELMVMEMANYTFGGVENADGINVSNGGWFPEGK